MNEKQNPEDIGPSEDLVEVWFRIEKDAEGYPETRTWEGMLSQRSRKGFVLKSVPFYLKNVSRGDTVVAVQDDFLRFSDVVARGGHNTYRLLMTDDADSEIQRAIADLENLGLTVERSENRILLAVDVPPAVNQPEIDDYLVEQQELGRWHMQDGFLSSIKTI
jgi:Domain of unknown function (DUF4265)